MATPTKRDLTAMGKFMFMGMIGLFIAMIVNLFLQAPALQFAISAIGVLIFAGLTAYDTQKIKEIYLEVDSSEIAGKKAIMGGPHPLSRLHPDVPIPVVFHGRARVAAAAASKRDEKPPGPRSGRFLFGKGGMLTGSSFEARCAGTSG